MMFPSRVQATLYFLAMLFGISTNCLAGIMFGGSSSNQLAGGYRWDAASRIIGGVERSLQGGLRYSVAGGNFETFRDQFTWSSTPTVSAFQTAVEQSFAAWTTPDPVNGLTSAISFTADFNTSVVGGGSFGVLNRLGAEIDLFAFNAGDNGTRGVAMIDIFGVPVTLTSQVANYAGAFAISGADIHINNNPGAVYTLDGFRRLLTHEIGHTIGLGDVEFAQQIGAPFIDDNFDPLNPVSTLNNSWSGLVNPLDPANSPGLSTFNIPPSVFQTTGVDLLMESNGLGISPGNPLSNLFPLTNDEYGMRQFLYPSVTAVPEPSSMGLLVVALLSLRVPSLVARRNPSKA